MTVTPYVWFDALLGYITALLEPDQPASLDQALANGWPAQLHVIGKDILRFHAVYWPAMCLSAGIELPDGVFGHGFLTREGKRWANRWGIPLIPAVCLSSVAAMLCAGICCATFNSVTTAYPAATPLDLVNNDLANTIGNLVNRSISMARKWFEGFQLASRAPR